MGADDPLVTINFDQQKIDRLTAEMDATVAQFQKALDRALRKMAAWLKTQSLRGLSKDLEIQQKILRPRLRTLKIKAEGGGKYGLWFGLDPIAYTQLGAPTQTPTGVRVGKRTVPGAFVGRDKNGKIHVWKRYGPRVPYDGSNPRYVGMKRQRLAEQRLDIKADAEKSIERIWGAREFEAQFFKLFEHELKYASKIEPGKNYFR